MRGARVVVVGASSGIGRAFASAAAEAGADVVLAARRAEPLRELGVGHPVVADVSDEAGRLALVQAALDHLGAIDLLMYAVGRADLGHLVDVDAEAWRVTLDTNVVALNQLLRVAVPDLAPPAIVAALSSETAGAPWSGLVAYAASKAALDTSLRGWQLEHPGLRFSVVSVGATQPTEFGVGFRGPMLGRALDEWSRRGHMQRDYMDTSEVAQVLVGLYGVALANPSVGVEHVVLRSPSPLA